MERKTHEMLSEVKDKQITELQEKITELQLKILQLQDQIKYLSRDKYYDC